MLSTSPHAARRRAAHPRPEAAVNAEAAPLTAARKKRGRWAIVGAVVVLVVDRRDRRVR